MTYPDWKPRTVRDENAFAALIKLLNVRKGTAMAVALQGCIVLVIVQASACAPSVGRTTRHEPRNQEPPDASVAIVRTEADSGTACETYVPGDEAKLPIYLTRPAPADGGAHEVALRRDVNSPTGFYVPLNLDDAVRELNAALGPTFASRFKGLVSSDP